MLTSLATEILVKIAENLDSACMLRLKNTCKRFSDLVNNDTVLQYAIEQYVQCVKDVAPLEPTGPKLARLRAYGEAWSALAFKRVYTIVAPTTSTCLFCQGIFVVLDPAPERVNGITFTFYNVPSIHQNITADNFELNLLFDRHIKRNSRLATFAFDPSQDLLLALFVKHDPIVRGDTYTLRAISPVGSDASSFQHPEFFVRNWQHQGLLGTPPPTIQLNLYGAYVSVGFTKTQSGERIQQFSEVYVFHWTTGELKMSVPDAVACVLLPDHKAMVITKWQRLLVYDLQDADCASTHLEFLLPTFSRLEKPVVFRLVYDQHRPHPTTQTRSEPTSSRFARRWTTWDDDQLFLVIYHSFSLDNATEDGSFCFAFTLSMLNARIAELRDHPGGTHCFLSDQTRQYTRFMPASPIGQMNSIIQGMRLLSYPNSNRIGPFTADNTHYTVFDFSPPEIKGRPFSTPPNAKFVNTSEDPGLLQHINTQAVRAQTNRRLPHRLTRGMLHEAFRELHLSGDQVLSIWPGEGNSRRFIFYTLDRVVDSTSEDESPPSSVYKTVSSWVRRSWRRLQ